jgi:hypothetical protein
MPSYYLDIFYKEKELKNDEKKYNDFKKDFKKKLKQEKRNYYLTIEKKYDFIGEQIDNISKNMDDIKFVL